MQARSDALAGKQSGRGGLGRHDDDAVSINTIANVSRMACSSVSNSLS